MRPSHPAPPAPDPIRVEELLIAHIAQRLIALEHVAVGASSPVPGAAALLARERSGGRLRVSILGSRKHTSFTDGGCAQVGVSHEIARRTDDSVALHETQRLYATWDADTLRLTWTGGDWDVDGDLFLYYVDPQSVVAWLRDRS